jgi:DNA-binding LytR/AlgR family response regulator
VNKVTILIVEDEILTATDIQESLEELGYEIVGVAQSAGDAIYLTKKTQPDLIILDITLAGNKDGIEAAEIIDEFWCGPIIFLTANSEKQLVNRAKNIFPAAYILKPFDVNQFSISLDLALNNYLNELNRISLKYGKILSTKSEAIYIPIDYCYRKIMKNDIQFVEASGSYIKIQTVDQSFTISTNLGNIEKQLVDDNFVRASRKYIINVNHVDQIESNVISVNNHKISIGESYKNTLMKHFQVIKTKQ